MRRPAGLRTVLVLGLVALAVLAAALTTPWRVDLDGRIPEPRVTVISPSQQAFTPAALQPEDEGRGSDAEWLLLVLAVVVALLLVLAGVLVARRLRHLTRETDEHDPDTLGPDATVADRPEGTVDLPALQDAITRALALLDQHPQPRDAVVAAWVAVEEEAARQGTDRDPAQTPTEFATTLLDRTPAPRDAVGRLRDLYHLARFTRRPVTPEQAHAARQALTEIARSLDETP